MPEDKQTQLAAYDKMMELLSIPASEKPKYLEGAAQLMDLGWPSNYIDLGMIDRYYLGLLPSMKDF